MTKKKQKPVNFCSGPKFEGYFKPGTNLHDPKLNEHPDWINPKWSPVQYCEHGRQYSHPITDTDVSQIQVKVSRLCAHDWGQGVTCIKCGQSRRGQLA